MASEFQENFSSIKLMSNTGYQLLLTSSLYGTNFAIFGKFSILEEGNTSTIQKLDLKIYNYKGILDLGFSTRHNTQITSKTNDEGESFVYVKLFLRAVVSGDEQINETQFEPLTAYRLSVIPEETIEISAPYYLKTERELIPISGNIDANPITNGVFDSEFYYRDGAEYFKKEAHGLPQAEQAGIEIKKINTSLFNETGPGRTCYKSAFHLVFNS